MNKFTLKEFKRVFPDDNACLERIFQIRYGHLKECPECKQPVKFKRISTRRCYQCRHCYEQFYPTAGTVFEKSTTPMVEWFFIIWLFTTTRNGVAAKEIERQLGVTYKTAWRMGHQIRKLMSRIGMEKLKGFVEVDETIIGSRYYGKDKRKKENKISVFGMVERTGKAELLRVEDTKKVTLFPIIEARIDKSAVIHTDENPTYVNIPSQLNIQHESINHSAGQYKYGRVTTNSIEGMFSQVKRMIYGTHLHVSEKYLQAYLNECTYRYNNREFPNEMFNTVLDKMTRVE